MAIYIYPSLRNAIASLSLFMLAFALPLPITGRPATFLEDFHITWSDSHIKPIDGGKAIQLVLDRNSGTARFSWGHMSF